MSWIIYYIGGYIVYKIFKNDVLHCETCKSCIEDPTRQSHLIDMKSLEYLKTPSEDLVEILTKVEVLLRDNEDKMFSDAFVQVILNEMEQYVKDHGEMFGGLSHNAEHKGTIMQHACALYLKARLHHEAQKISAVEKYIRRSFTKLILFQNQ